MPKMSLSVTIITLNEEQHIASAIESVRWADEVVVVDSGSSDRTVDIAKSLGAKVLVNPWPGYGKQKNFAQQQAAHDWVLNIDADEVVPPELAAEIQEVIGATTTKPAAFYFPRKTFYIGRWIRHGGWYPNHLVRLADRRKAAWTEPSVHEELLPLDRTAEIRGLRAPLHHYSFGSIEDQILTNLRFSRLGSKQLQKTGQKFSLPLLLLKPLGKFIECYFLKQGFLDGLPGFIISVNAAHSMFLKYAYLAEEKLHAHSDHR